MQRLVKAIEDIMVAITFAEAGEYDSARHVAIQEEISDAMSCSGQITSNEA